MYNSSQVDLQRYNVNTIKITVGLFFVFFVKTDKICKEIKGLTPPKIFEKKKVRGVTDFKTEHMVAEREETVREFGMVMYTLLYLKWITNKVLQYSTRNSAQCYVVAWMGRSLGENGDTCICMAEPLCGPPETITVLLIGYIPIQNRRRQWQPTPVLLPGKSHGWRSLVGCSPWDC